MRRLVVSGLALVLLAMSGTALAAKSTKTIWVADVSIADGHSVSSDAGGSYIYGHGSKNMIADEPDAYDWFSFYTYFAQTYSPRFFRLNIAGALQGDCRGNYDGIHVKSHSSPQWFPGWSPVQGHAIVGCTIGGTQYKVSFGSDAAECVAITPIGADSWHFTANCVGNVAVAKAVGKKGNTSYETISSGHSATFDISADIRCTSAEWRKNAVC